MTADIALSVASDTCGLFFVSCELENWDGKLAGLFLLRDSSDYIKGGFYVSCLNPFALVIYYIVYLDAPFAALMAASTLTLSSCPPNSPIVLP